MYAAVTGVVVALYAGAIAAVNVVLATLGMAPFAPYHWLVYGHSLWFDVTRARTDLGWEPTHSNASMIIESYEWYLAHRGEIETESRSHHQSPARPGLLRMLKRLG